MSGTRRLAAIMFTDVVGYTAAMQADEAGTLARLRALEARVRPVLGRYGGREVKSTGDGLLVEFESAVKAVGCAIEIARTLGETSPPGTARPPELRIGIHVGEVEESGGDIFGDAVNVAARVVGFADPGGVCLSQPVHDLVSNRLDAQFERLPPKVLKGVRSPPTLYRLVLPSPVASGPPRTADGLTRLAVLPLSNISPDPKDEYFADGLTEELIAVLSQVRGLRVIARTSVNQYRSTTRSVVQIGNELGVDSVLEGSVRKSGSHLRITLQLIDARTQEHTWAQSYNRELDDVFAIQSEVAERTASALRTQLGELGRGPVGRAPTANLEAYDAYLRGIHAAQGARTVSFEEADAYFAEATRLDPQFASAYSHWANTYTTYQGEVFPLSRGCLRAKELVARALELDPRSSDAHMAAGNIAMQCDLDWSRAESEFREAIELNPSNALAREWYGALLHTLRRFSEGKVVLEKALEGSPRGKSILGWLVLVHIATGDLEVAERFATRATNIPPPYPMDRVRLAYVLMTQGRGDDAIAEIPRADYTSDVPTRYYCTSLLATLGRPEEARALLAEVGRPGGPLYLSLARRAGLQAVLGDTEAALATLEDDFRKGDRSLWFEYQYWAFDSVRSDPRFHDLLRRYHLPPDAAAEGPTRGTGGPGSPGAKPS